MYPFDKQFALFDIFLDCTQRYTKHRLIELSKKAVKNEQEFKKLSKEDLQNSKDGEKVQKLGACKVLQNKLWYQNLLSLCNVKRFGVSQSTQDCMEHLKTGNNFRKEAATKAMARKRQHEELLKAQSQSLHRQMEKDTAMADYFRSLAGSSDVRARGKIKSAIICAKKHVNTLPKQDRAEHTRRLKDLMRRLNNAWDTDYIAETAATLENSKREEVGEDLLLLLEVGDM